jgi:hypothetical protein
MSQIFFRRVSGSEVARMATMRNFAHKPRSLAKSHAESPDWQPLIPGKMSASPMALQLQTPSAYEK